MMKAVRYYGKEDIRIENIPEPECGEGMVKIVPAFVGICGTDLHEYEAGPNFNPTSPHPITGDKIPVTVGHEFSGIVKAVGEGVDEFRVGQKVAVQPTLYCGSCGACSTGVENVCPKGGFYGLSGFGGGLSGAIVVPPRSVIALPEETPLDIGALVEPLAVGWHAISASPFASGFNILLLGGGPIGLSILQCLRARKAGTVAVVELAAQRRKFAREFGANYVLDPSQVDVVEKSKEIFGGTGPDIVFDCAGVAASLKTSCLSVRPRGTVVNVAIWPKEVPFLPNWLVFREANYKSVLGYQRQDFEAVVSAIASGALKPAQMITSKIPMDDIISKGYMPLIHEKEKHVKILVDLAA